MTDICLCGYGIEPGEGRDADESLPVERVHIDRATCLRAGIREDANLIGVTDAVIAQRLADDVIEATGLISRASIALHDLLSLTLPHGVRVCGEDALREVVATRRRLVDAIDAETKGIESA